MDIAEPGVTLLSDVCDISIGDKSVGYVNANGQTRTMSADSVIVAKGVQAELPLLEDLKSSGFRVYSVGDCSGVGYLNEAFSDAAQVARYI